MLHKGSMLEVSSIGRVRSSDGIHFKDHKQFIVPEHEWEQFGCEDPRVIKFDDKYFIFYTALSTYPFSPKGISVGVAITKDLKKIDEKHHVTPFNSKAMAIFPEKINGKIVGILTADTDLPPAKIAVAHLDEESQLWSEEYWNEWYANLDSHVIPLQRNIEDHIEIGAPPVKTKKGWLLIYSYIRNYLNEKRTFGIEAVLLDLKDPQKIIARTEVPLMVPEEEYELYGKVPNVVFPSGVLVERGKLHIYYGAADTTCCKATCDLKELIKEMVEGKKSRPAFERFSGNPILEPIKGEKVRGYEIHMGETDGGDPAFGDDGSVSENGLVIGTYLHGLFENENIRDSFLGYLYKRKGLNYTGGNHSDGIEELAAFVEAHLEMDLIYKLMEGQ